MDQFVAAYKDAVLGNYANFNGRLSVGGYWRFVGLNFAIFVVLAILMAIVDILVVLIIVYWLALIVPSLAATVRRLHDTDKPTIYILLAFVPCVSLVLLYFTVQPGTPGDNQFGPVPVT